MATTGRLMRAAAAVLSAVGLAGFGWTLPWPDPAQAGAALQWCGWCLLCAVIYGLTTHRELRIAAAAGFGVGLAGAGCAAGYRVLSQVDGVCDEGTGRPVTAAVAWAVLALAAEIMRGWHGSRSSG